MSVGGPPGWEEKMDGGNRQPRGEEDVRDRVSERTPT